jgi:hypothetical protein
MPPSDSMIRHPLRQRLRLSSAPGLKSNRTANQAVQGSARKRAAPNGQHSAKTNTLPGLMALSFLLVGCAHYQRTWFRVVDSVSGEPVPSARLSAPYCSGPLAFGDLFRPEWTYPQKQEASTQSNGLAKLKVPMSMVGAAVAVTKPGYDDRVIGRYSNKKWREIGRASSPGSPLVVGLTRNDTEPGRASNGSQPVRSVTNRTSSAAGSPR